jgi:Fic family protein
VATDERLRTTLELLEDPRFGELRRIAEERPISWDEFEQMTQPSGMSPAQTWELLTLLRRQTAVDFPFRDSRGRRGWCSLTRSMMSDYADIDWRCHQGSRLDQAIRSRNATYFLIEAHVNDAVTAIRDDGVALGYERAREILLGEREPSGPDELILLNSHRARWDLEDLGRQRCTPELIRRLHRRVTKGAEQPSVSSPDPGSEFWEGANLDSEASLDLISRMVNNEGVDVAEHPVLLSMAIHWVFMSNLPLPTWNGVMASLIMKLCFIKSRLPVLVYIPILKTHNAWQDGAIRPPVVPVPFSKSMVQFGDEVDFTIYAGALAHLVRLDLGETERELRRALMRDEALSETLQFDPNINYRQRAVLSRALDHPEASFRIETHRTHYRVAYATARADLLKLASMGFLECVREKRAFVFTPSPGLRAALRGRAAGRSGLDAELVSKETA